MAVFQNAGIYALKKLENSHVTVHTPKEFAACYFHCDSVVEISRLTYQNYGEVSNYRFRDFKKKELGTWISPQLPNYIFERIQQRLPSNAFHRLPASLRADYKARKYLFQSGIYREIKKREKKQKSHFLGTSNYLDLSNLETYRCDISEAMFRNFQNLSQMIRDGSVQTIKQIESFSINEPTVRNEGENENQQLIKKAEEFINLNSRVAYIRTRNIQGQAAVHNTNPKKLRLLIETLLSIGWAVLNTGTPTFELDIGDSKYLEFHHNLPIGDQFYLASKCDARVMSAESGLFVAWAATELPLVLIGEEWSVKNLRSPVSLIESRKLLGIRDQLLDEDFTKAEIISIFKDYC
jgi:hypothetical protein